MRTKKHFRKRPIQYSPALCSLFLLSLVSGFLAMDQPATVGVYYHPLENFDDDVDRLKGFVSNPLGGNRGIIYEVEQVMDLSYEKAGSISGNGRYQRLQYTDLQTWSMLAFSLHRSWYDKSSALNMNDLFPDFNIPDFQNRRIDSIAFNYRLNASDPLFLQLHLEDTLTQSAVYCVEAVNSGAWERISVAIDDFSGTFDPTKAKFFGINLANLIFCGPNSFDNTGASGTLDIDDLVLVEKDYEKPVFSTDADLLDYINKVNFRHFWMAVDPVSKLALDRHIWGDLIAVDAVGFQLSAYVIAHRHNWVDRTLIEARVEHILDYLLNVCQHTDQEAEAVTDPTMYASVRGIWAHFLDNKSLSRKDTNTEYSLFTNALLLSGVLTAERHFADNSNIVSMAQQLYAMSDWNFLYRPEDGLMYYHWAPETGLSQYYSDWFSEELDLAFLLGMAAPLPEHRLPANPYFSPEYRRPRCADGDYIYSAPGANFTYYFLQMYARFEEHTERFVNSRNALLQDLKFSQQNYGSLGYDPRIFGHTACEGPDSAGFTVNGLDTMFISNYHAYGYACRFDETNQPNGTIAVYGTAAPILFIPEASIAALKYYYGELDDKFRNDYRYPFFSPIFSFPDAFHLNPENCDDPLVNVLDFNGPWISAPRFGIDVGPMLMNIDSYLTEKLGYYDSPSVRDLFSEHPLIKDLLQDFEEIPSNMILKDCSFLELFTPGQQYGVMDIDKLSLSSLPEDSGIFLEVEGEDAVGATTGRIISRAAASNDQVWGQFGTTEQVGFPAQNGSVWYSIEHPTYEETVYFRIHYSRNQSAQTAPPVDIKLDGFQLASFTPEHTGDWNAFTASDWIPLTFGGGIPDLIPEPPVTNALYLSSGTIRSAERIESEEEVTFLGGNSVVLEAGFKVDAGAVFTAATINCTPQTGTEAAADPGPETTSWVEQTTAKGTTDGVISESTLRDRRPDLLVVPNPFSDQATVQFFLPEPSSLTLDLYRFDGVRMKRLYTSTMATAGWHTEPLDGTELPPGIYLVVLEAAGEINYQKVILIP